MLLLLVSFSWWLSSSSRSWWRGWLWIGPSSWCCALCSWSRPPELLQLFSCGRKKAEDRDYKLNIKLLCEWNATPRRSEEESAAKNINKHPQRGVSGGHGNRSSSTISGAVVGGATFMCTTLCNNKNHLQTVVYSWTEDDRTAADAIDAQLVYKRQLWYSRERSLVVLPALCLCTNSCWCNGDATYKCLSIFPRLMPTWNIISSGCGWQRFNLLILRRFRGDWGALKCAEIEIAHSWGFHAAPRTSPGTATSAMKYSTLIVSWWA